ncbi:MAG TPA: alpha/beta hydrolase, partial [Phenylobacterium sp.]|nr:alpha/beta hydrolase [Phenylobacterium sp.]
TRLPRPWIVVGHSMGGALTLLHLLAGSRFDGAVLSSPMTGVNLKGNSPTLVKIEIAGRRLFGRLGDYVEAPTSSPWDDQFAGNSVTHDAARFHRTVSLLQTHHDVALGGPTWGWLDFALSAASTIQSSAAAATLKIPLRVVAAGDERLADTPATQAFCARVPGAQCVVAPGACHEILMELDATRALFWQAFDGVAAALPYG